MIIREENIKIPLTVPKGSKNIYCENYLKATLNSGRLFLFAGDQKIEHLNEDFFGPGISEEDAHPKHLFKIAQASRIGVFASHLGLIARYGDQYRSNVQYIVKLNGKTNLVKTEQKDPISYHLHSVEQVIQFKESSGLDILGVGCTVYLGSEHEGAMLRDAAQMVHQAHQNGLLAILWMYPRGRAVSDERDAQIIAGAAGVAVSLGADFVKLNAPEADDAFESAQLFRQATNAAGNTKIIYTGGVRKNEKIFLEQLYHKIHKGRAGGVAIGRNIHQKNLADAIKFCESVASIVIDDADVSSALHYLR